jgi:acetoin utilization deacetylase AcuC-like enzyme
LWWGNLGAVLSLYSDDRFEDHATPEDHPECPERARAVCLGLRDVEEISRREGASAGAVADVERVHDPDYVRAIAAAAEAGGGALDPDTHVSPASYEVALLATGTVVKATNDALADGAPPAFVVVRPPGHHARPARGMGFCLFNNVAVAAARAREVHGLERVAVVDFDVHHGNGTQDAFWSDGSVLFTSVHQWPYYPGTGAKDETGVGAGKGTTLNLPVAARSKPEVYVDAVRAALDRVTSFDPDLLLVSAGFDAYAGDPLAALTLEAEHFRTIGAELRRAADATCGGRLVAAFEGGYALDALGDLAAAFCRGMATGNDG